MSSAPLPSHLLRAPCHPPHSWPTCSPISPRFPCHRHPSILHDPWGPPLHFERGNPHTSVLSSCLVEADPGQCSHFRYVQTRQQTRRGADHPRPGRPRAQAYSPEDQRPRLSPMPCQVQSHRSPAPPPNDTYAASHAASHAEQTGELTTSCRSWRKASYLSILPSSLITKRRHHPPHPKLPSRSRQFTSHFHLTRRSSGHQ